MLSFAETLTLDCPNCATPFTAETWVTIDGAERPDLVARILDGSLHAVQCPQCGHGGMIPAPLLFHDGRAGRVLLAVPPGMAESEWREAGQTLLWSLIGALPESQRLPYLGELQAEQGLAGIAQVIRAEHLAGTAEDTEVLPPIVLAVEALLAARTPGEWQRVLHEHPILTEPQAVTILRELAHAAFQQDEEEAGRGFSRAADVLVELAQLVASSPLAPTTLPPTPAAADTDAELEEFAFAILRTQSGADLAAVIDTYPELLDPASDAVLAAWSAATRAAGKPRMADGMDERRQALAEMRAEYARQQPVLDAIQVLLAADSAEAVEEAIVEYAELTTPAADELLGRLAEGADPEVAAIIAERRALLAQVRAILEG